LENRDQAYLKEDIKRISEIKTVSPYFSALPDYNWNHLNHTLRSS